MKTQRNHRNGTTQEPAATNSRSLRTFLLAMQFEAKEIGQRIAQARTEAGLTQEALAEMASFSKRSLQDYEAGVTVPYKHMREISQFLSRPIEWFLHGEQVSQPPPNGDVASALEGVTAALHALTDRVGRLEKRLPPESAQPEIEEG